MTALAAPTQRAPRPKQSAADRAAVYAYVTARDVTCRAPAIDVTCSEAWCKGPLQRHHAGNKIGTPRKTDTRHVILLCEWHHATWAPSHSRLILAWLDHVETRAGR